MDGVHRYDFFLRTVAPSNAAGHAQPDVGVLFEEHFSERVTCDCGKRDHVDRRLSGHPISRRFIRYVFSQLEM